TCTPRPGACSSAISARNIRTGTRSRWYGRPHGDSLMEHVDLLRHVVGVLGRLGVPYFITGSTATIFFGEPRFTNDVDVVADLGMEHIPALLAAFPPDEYYLSDDAVRQAVARRFQFNIIHPTSGLKVDVI